MKYCIDTSGWLDGWVRDYPPDVFVVELLSDHPRLVDTHRYRSQADPFVIETAEYLGATVVTGETPRGKLDKPKIPDVCSHRGTRCISFLEMLREIGWKF